MIIVYALAVLCPLVGLGWIIDALRRDATLDGFLDINKIQGRALAALQDERDDLLHTLQDEEREHTACELDLDESEMELLECADGIEGYVKTVAEQDAKIVAQAEFICEQGDQITALEDEIINLRISAAGRTKIPKKSRKAS